MSWLVVGPPLWKMMEFVNWDDETPNISLGINGTIKFMATYGNHSPPTRWVYRLPPRGIPSSCDRFQASAFPIGNRLRSGWAEYGGSLMGRWENPRSPFSRLILDIMYIYTYICIYIYNYAYIIIDICNYACIYIYYIIMHTYLIKWMGCKYVS